MSTDFSTKVLVIAEKKETERFNTVKEKVLELFSKICQMRVQQLSPFIPQEIVDIPINDLVETDIQNSDFIRICTASGIPIGEDSFGEKIEISIPDLSTISEKQPIKSLFYRTNLEINSIIEAENNAAKELCAEVSQKLLAGDFELEYKPKYEGMVGTIPPSYHIFVNIPSQDMSPECISHAREIMEQKGFSLSINAEKNLWELSIDATNHDNF